ncbi:MAG: B12-binding domain-containing radical SAM protein [candidate division KSB1 bacterium]|nr:B12-binding domain-containing radical SAM protein [candidate division KSB1 bacterium]MDZ7275893.1 B12-binding domain-containing radical SAM protein [candidate division KSB1 bacterium]MDZ7287643.1 B12-binding domain-containing radical SAM protein [candidate division KSB1 bacterium]MDZ7306805.1 B12-binding domain-containing radical SAM protein [candidate division KSB1 bacterium]MDZ7350621.1 B12-binding domain-containing radical SAM protein [candidate division KSB1 bacterium]
MDLLLCHGYFLQDDAREREIMKPYPPLGLLYLCAYLKQRDFAVEIFDGTFAARQDFVQLLAAKQPAVVGLYANLMTKGNVLAMIQQAKQHHCAVIVGGPDPPCYAEEYLDCGADIVVIGEGEQTLEELLPILLAGSRDQLVRVAGIVFRDEHGRVQRTPARPLLPDLDLLPLPDRGAIALHQYVDAWRTHHGTGAVSLITSRGCPYSCTWCSHSVFGKSLRKRSPHLCAEEVELLRATYHPDLLWYADDVFNINHKWLFEYAAELRRRAIKLPFECICRADRLNEDIVALLAAMGCFRVWLGSESGSQRLLDQMKRGVKAEQVQAMTRLARRYGLETGMFLMWGFEDENEDDIAATIDHVKKASPDLVLTTVSYPIKGTEYYQRMAGQNLIVSNGKWRESSDRDHRIRGRHSRRYYDFASRWLYGELAMQRLRENGGGSWLARARAAVQAKIGKLGMVWTAHEREA